MLEEKDILFEKINLSDYFYELTLKNAIKNGDSWILSQLKGHSLVKSDNKEFKKSLLNTIKEVEQISSTRFSDEIKQKVNNL